jgi:transposase
MSDNKGRPSRIFETERIEEFLQLIEDGVDFNIAADSARLARSTVFEWLSKGRDIENMWDESSELSVKDKKFLDFLERYKRARVAPEIKAVETISRSVEKGSWRAAAWMLESRFPERWSEKRSLNNQIRPMPPQSEVNSNDLATKVESILQVMRESRDH